MKLLTLFLFGCTIVSSLWLGVFVGDSLSTKFESGWYMASTSQIHKKYNNTMGVIHSAGFYKHVTKSAKHGIYRTRLSYGVPLCIDNGVFTGVFDENHWVAKVEALSEYKNQLLFISVPDVLHILPDGSVIGDCAATLAQFNKYRSMIKDYPAALVSQDGIREHAGKIPWDDFDCLFVGGSNEHKLGKEGGWIINEAKKRNKWVHIGRVNSPKRILDFWLADSWDGTHLGFMPYDVIKFHAAVLQARSMKKTKGLFDDLHNSLSHGNYSGQSF